MQLDRPKLVVMAMLACLIVAGCGRKVEERGKAAGEVLEGTISDGMIATDAVRSEPPIAPRKAEASGARVARQGAGAPVGEEEADPSAAPAPAPAPEAAPAPPATASEPAA